MFDYLVSRYDGAIMFLPQRLRTEARKADRQMRKKAEEIRLRIGKPLSILTDNVEIALGDTAVTKRDIDILIEIATDASAYSVSDRVKEGFITVNGGHRIGLCGSATVKNGEMYGFRTVSSAAIRISKEVIGAADGVINEVIKDGKFCSTLIISSPGGGKTTLLRDMIRQLSDGDKYSGRAPFRISVADERSEIAVLYGGTPQMNVGLHTDIMDGCPKDKAILCMLRSMNPQIIALDEITSVSDVETVIKACYCGVGLLATAHAFGANDLKNRQIYKTLLSYGIFEKFIMIQGSGDERRYKVAERSEL